MTNRSGFVNVIKPTGVSSSNVVCKVKKILNEKKVGHLGTLDPAASGVLPIAFGKATKFFDYFLSKDKEYVAVVQFGVETDSLDSFGVVTNNQNINVTEDQINAVLPDFIGKISQIPPKFSAIKIGGKMACELARNGENVEIKPREIEVFSIDLIDRLQDNRFRFKVHCSAGTYIRTLFQDIAKKLDTISTTTVIIRSRSGAFDIGSAITLDELEKSKITLSVDDVFGNLKKYDVSNNEILKKLLNGVKLSKQELNFDDINTFFITNNNKNIGMYHYDKDKLVCDVFLWE